MSSPCPGHHQLAATDPRADADVAEPPAIVIREALRRRLCKTALRKAILDDLDCDRTFYKADRVRGQASNRVAEDSTATPLLRERRGGRYKCPWDLFRADSNSDPDKGERTLSIVKTAEHTNPCHDHCGEASVPANEARIQSAFRHAVSPTPTLAIDG